MRKLFLGLASALFCCRLQAQSPQQGTVPAFSANFGKQQVTVAGSDPSSGGGTTTTTIPVVLVPVSLHFASRKPMDAASQVRAIEQSPLFTPYAFEPGAAPLQYGDAMLRATFSTAPKTWHTTLGKPEVRPVRIDVPVGFGYVLTSRKSGKSMAIADVQFVQREIFKQIPKQNGKLVMLVTHNTAYYALGDATVCCSWGTHGVDAATGNSFVLASYLHDAPAVVEDADIQPLTQQFAQFLKDPVLDPLVRVARNARGPGNYFNTGWLRPASSGASCGGIGVGSTYFLLEPTNTNPKNNIPASKPFAAKVGSFTYHLQNVALLPWYTGASDDGTRYSFPDSTALPSAASPCPGRGPGGNASTFQPTVAPAKQQSDNGHKLIGYWAGYGGPGSTIPMRELSPQWDYVLVAFATPDKNAPEGTMQFRTPGGLDTEAFKADIAFLKSQGRKVMISLGGGGQHFTLADSKRVPNFVSSVIRIVTEYGFDGIDIDFESPSLSIDPGDTDFRKPTTPSIVNLISAIRQVHAHFGPGFLVSLVPEGTQIPAGFPSYGGQFGSYLPIAHALRDMLAFMDVQDYNTPPLLGLDGEIYQPGTVDYHAAMTELLLHGFPVGGNADQFFPPIPANKIAVGFLTGDTTPTIVNQAMDYIITGKAPAGTRYKLRNPAGYPGMIGAMFWTIDADRRGNYLFSNVVGPLLRSYPASKR